MATLFPPKNVIRMRKQPTPPASWGHKWHLVAPRKSRSKTACGIILKPSCNAWAWEAGRIEDIDPDDICSGCWPYGLVYISPKKKRS